MKNTFNNPRFTLLHFPLIAIGSFILLLICASTFYPGGTVNNPETIRYIFSENYISDLGRVETPSGVKNVPSVFIFIIALLIMSFSFFLYFYNNYRFYKNKYSINSSTFKLGSFFGLCFSLCFLGVAITPADVNLNDHIIYAEWLFRFLFGCSFLLFIAFYKINKSTFSLSIGYFLIAFSNGVYILLSDFKLISLIFNDVHYANVISQKIITISLILGFVFVGYFNNRILKQK